MKTILFFILFSLSFYTFSQNKVLAQNAHFSEPVFPGGKKNFDFYISHNYENPTLAYDRWGPYQECEIVIEVIIDKAGVVRGTRMVHSLGYNMDPIFLRMFSEMPKWEPAKKNGEPVNCKITYPLKTLKGQVEIISDEDVKDNLGVYIEPKFPGGYDSLFAFVYQQIQVPEKLIKKEKNEAELIRLTIDTTGHVSRVEPLHSLSSRCDTISTHILDHSPQWIPAFRNGKKVESEFVIEVFFDALMKTDYTLAAGRSLRDWWPKYQRRYEFILQLIDEKDYLKALKEIKNRLEEEPENIELIFLKSTICCEQGELERGCMYLDVALELGNKNGFTSWISKQGIEKVKSQFCNVMK